MKTNWQLFFEQEKQKDYFKDLMCFIDSEYNSKIVYPPKNMLFKAFELTDLTEIKVVILGQDPYHGPNQANGLSFSVNDGVNFPPSLRNIFKELQQDAGVEIPISGNLEHWAKQGVFLLNDVLSVAQGLPGSHQKKGWEQFTANVVEYISSQTTDIIFLLWGNYAQKKGKKIDKSKHVVLESGHPSPMSANQGKWFGNKHFSKTNDYLKLKNKDLIIW